MNTVNIIGNLTRDPEMAYTQSGKAIAKMSIAVNKNYTKNGEKVQEVSYFSVDAWGATAENCAKYLTKGSKVAVTGELKQDRWDKDGQVQSRVKIVAGRVEFLSPKKEGNGQPTQQSQDDGSGQWSE